MTQERGNAFATLSDAMADAAARAGAAVVAVNARRRLPGSGVIFGEGLVITADHVVERDEDISILLADGSSRAAQVAGRDHSSDLAVLRIEGGGLAAAQGGQAEARVGQLVLALGRPNPASLEASLGIVSAVGGPVRTGRGGLLEGYLRTDAVPYPGFSGGPLVNGLGEVIGINTSGLGRGAFLSIPARVAWQIARTLADHGRIRRGYLGVRSQMVELPAGGRSQLGREQETGLLLLSVEANSPAGQGGLMVGDILVTLNGEPVAEPDDLMVGLSGNLVGQPVPVQVLRGGRLETITVTIGES